MSDGDRDFVTRAECAAISGRVADRLDLMHEEMTKQGLAIYGADGLGGMQRTLISIEECLNDREEVKELSTRRMVAYIGAVTAVGGPIVLLLMQILLRHLGLL